METLDPRYLGQLDLIKQNIQSSEILERYLDEEDEAVYKELQDAFEPMIHELYEYVAYYNPLQLEELEKAMFDSEFEGLYLPKILGYSILRGEVDHACKYVKPQDHFKQVLLTICESANFELIRKRIGQSVQVGFALSSDIWISNLIEQISNKKIKSFLSSQKNEKYRDIKQRRLFFDSYSRQFSSINFQSARFPNTDLEAITEFNVLKKFLIYRSVHGFDNTSLIPYIDQMLEKSRLGHSRQIVELVIVIGLYYDLDEATQTKFVDVLEYFNGKHEDFAGIFFEIYDGLYQDEAVTILPYHEQRMHAYLAKFSNKEVTTYFQTVNALHGLGVVHTDAIDIVRAYYDSHTGMSLQNECLRLSVLGYFARLIPNLEVEAYQDYFEINKIITIYIGIFSNEKFNQSIKDLSMVFIYKCLAKFKDKRARDYQDIRKFVMSVFLDLGFLKEKEIAELFKTKRTKK